MISATITQALTDNTVVLRIIRPGTRYQGKGGDELTPANFQRRSLREGKEPGLSVSISGILSDKDVLLSFAKDGNIKGFKLAECTIKELHTAGFEVTPNPTHNNKAHAQLRCVSCDSKKIDCFPNDNSECSFDVLELQRDLADLFSPHNIAN